MASFSIREMASLLITSNNAHRRGLNDGWIKGWGFWNTCFFEIQTPLELNDKAWMGDKRPPFCLNNNPHVAIVGASGAVGVEMIRTLERRIFP